MNRRNFLTTSAAATGAVIFGPSTASAQESSQGPFALPKLPYAYDALEPHIDAQTMQIHHGKHHAGYTKKLNIAIAQSTHLKGKSIEDILSRLADIEDPSLQVALRNNGGGFYNHCLFWEFMAPASKTGQASQELSKAITETFGSLSAMQETFNREAASRFGSGWAWLILQNDQLKIVSTPNQDNPLMRGIVPESILGTPLLGVDIWEHAYYLKYQNRRSDYLSNWWKAVNWNEVSKRFSAAS